MGYRILPIAFFFDQSPSFAMATKFKTKLAINGSSSPVLTATSLSYGKAKNLTPTESKPLTRLR